MDILYYIVLGISILFHLYTSVFVILVVKFVNSLPTIMKAKYYSLARISKIVVIVSSIILLMNFVTPQHLFKILILIISMFLNSYTISEMSILKKYI